MWAVRAGLHFLVQLAVAVAIGLVVAVLWALARGGGFRHALSIGFIAIGSLMILLGASGQSGADRTLETGGRLPGLPAWTQSQPGDTSVRPGALLILGGLVLIAIGIVLSG